MRFRMAFLFSISRYFFASVTSLFQSDTAALRRLAVSWGGVAAEPRDEEPLPAGTLWTGCGSSQRESFRCS
jgi:hypothetical protein